MTTKSVRKRRIQKTCYCTGYWFPHRLGSKYCSENFHKLTEEDWDNHPALSRRKFLR